MSVRRRRAPCRNRPVAGLAEDATGFRDPENGPGRSTRSPATARGGASCDVKSRLSRARPARRRSGGLVETTSGGRDRSTTIRAGRRRPAPQNGRAWPSRRRWRPRCRSAVEALDAVTIAGAAGRRSPPVAQDPSQSRHQQGADHAKSGESGDGCQVAARVMGGSIGSRSSPRPVWRRVE